MWTFPSFISNVVSPIAPVTEYVPLFEAEYSYCSPLASTMTLEPFFERDFIVRNRPAARSKARIMKSNGRSAENLNFMDRL